MSREDDVPCRQTERISLYALRALPADETADVEAHLAKCPECQRELEALGPVIDALASWPTDVLRPPDALWERLARRIEGEAAGQPNLARTEPWSAPAWESVAPGIACKVLAIDGETRRVSMLVRLAPGAEYPPHTHADVEELHLLHGELWIDDRRLSPGDYSRAEAGTQDLRVWSETGCTCVLITSTQDTLYK